MRTLTYFNTLQKPVNIKASALLIIHIWSNSHKVQSLGLQEEYRAKDSALKKFVQKMAATAFCPPPFMQLAWQRTQQEAPTMYRVDDLVTYFDRTWVNGSYKLSHWNYYDYEGP